MSPEVLIYANAGEDVGLGHLVRCIALARELTDRNVSVELHSPDGAAEEFILEQGLDRERVRLDTSLAATTRTEADVVVVDSYAATEADFRAIRDAATLVVVDELGDRTIPACLVVNSNVYAHDVEYPAADDVLRGPDYSMLRPVFRDLPAPMQSQPPEDLLVTIGGSDLTGSLSDVLDLLATVVDSETTVQTIVGPYFERPSEPPENAVFHREPDDIHELMLTADLAVSGGGQTLYELAATGTPPVAMLLGPDQARNIDAWSENGFCVPVGAPVDEDFEKRLRSGVVDLYLNEERRRERAARGLDAVDGYGAGRVADAVIERY